jgi:ribosomal protein S12 methylthiotransferase accessory factor YcaO
MHIRSVAKHSPADSERVMPAEDMLARASMAAGALGVTRLGNITGLDRLGLPVYTAVVPKSDDTISVYNGKGVRPEDARAGALMEAIERQTALNHDLPVIEASLDELRRGGRAVAGPRSFTHRLCAGFADDLPYLWTEAYDLIGREPVLVPAGLAGYGPKYAASSPFEINSSNGLASGNCFEEAVCHALCELIERDAMTLADLRCRWIPRALREATLGAEAGAQGRDDPSGYPPIDLADAGHPFPELLAGFGQAGLRPIVRDTTSDLGICCAAAAVADDLVPGFPLVHCGIGTHPNARIAVVRALVELAQSRAVDIQGAREDLVAAGAPADPAFIHTRRVDQIDKRRWLLQEDGQPRPFRDIPSYEYDDVAQDIGLILSRLEGAGLRRALVVDFGGPCGFSVVRVMVPGLEFWWLDQGEIGPRALEFWRQHVR